MAALGDSHQEEHVAQWLKAGALESGEQVFLPNMPRLHPKLKTTFNRNLFLSPFNYLSIYTVIQQIFIEHQGYAYVLY